MWKQLRIARKLKAIDIAAHSGRSRDATLEDMQARFAGDVDAANAFVVSVEPSVSSDGSEFA